MDRIAAWMVQHTRKVWASVLVITVVLAVLAGELVHDFQEREHVSLLRTRIERYSIEIMSQTLKGNLIGSLSLLGLIEPAIKQDVRGLTAPNQPALLSILESVARAHAAGGVFLVGTQGTINSSWDSTGKPSTGLNVKFRPYYQMAMRGQENVYAAVSLARGDRALYFTAPVLAESMGKREPIGAVVARTDLAQVDAMLGRQGDIALLLSPQGIVFASSRAEWIGALAGESTPERLSAIRALKQFGNMFEQKEPVRLPIEAVEGRQLLEGRPYAVVTAPVEWNDPSGHWQLVSLEDLSRAVPAHTRIRVSAGVWGVLLIISTLLLKLLRSRHAQTVTNQQLTRYAATQHQLSVRKTHLAAAAQRFQTATSIEELAQYFLGAAHKQIKALQGTVYVIADDTSTTPDMVPELHLAATYACAHDVPSILKSGESLIGQCLVERRTRILETTEQSGWNIHSGLGSTRPTAVIIAPILLHNAILGVVELATLAMPDETDLEQCDEMTTLLAMNLEILRRNLSIHAMLAEKIVAEQQLEHQLILQQTLLDTIPYPVFYKGADTRFIGVNRAYEETFGITRTSLIGKRVLDLGYLPEADRLAYQAEDEATIASTGTIRRDMKIPFADGQFHDTLYFVAGFRDRDGKPGGLVGTFIEANLVRKSVKQPPAPAVVEAMPMEPIPATLTLDQLVDMDELRKLFSSFCNAIGVPAALIDLQGQVLASSRWQRACTGFHRVHPESCRRCLESDTELALKLEHGTPFTRYTCRNGMTDCASPIIVEGHHLANVFIGQFHIGPPDLEFFMQQARQFGYEEEDYRQAILEAPVMDERKLPVILEFLTGFARMVTTMALARRRSDEAQQRLAQYVELLQRERTVELNP